MTTDAFCIVAYAALGQVQRVRRQLLNRGRFADMIRTPRTLAHSGCGFSLRVSAPDLDTVRDASDTAGIPIRAVFRETRDGYEALP